MEIKNVDGKLSFEWDADDVRRVLEESGYAPTAVECDLVLMECAKSAECLLTGVAKSFAINHGIATIDGKGDAE